MFYRPVGVENSIKFIRKHLRWDFFLRNKDGGLHLQLNPNQGVCVCVWGGGGGKFKPPPPVDFPLIT